MIFRPALQSYDPIQNWLKALVLEADDLVELRDLISPVCRLGKLGILIGQVFVGYPATAGTEASYVDGDFGRDYLGHQLLEWREANALYVVGHSAVHQHNCIADQDDGRLVPGIQSSIGHNERKGRLGRIFATVRSDEKFTRHDYSSFFYTCRFRAF